MAAKYSRFGKTCPLFSLNPNNQEVLSALLTEELLDHGMKDLVLFTNAPMKLILENRLISLNSNVKVFHQKQQTTEIPKYDGKNQTSL